ncbi:hypothetical protein C7B82_11270 [Stenomitos frigidus ULC18]|uniref:Transposase IS701-like DDE domain-containing protein n=1 Tax=Stenomitos frigidus ULC18 TaxID=2107698 RepID=A0A2T1E9M4_9CYAN|nr:hypothetical protein C7B82_11270 [Stenomitos frigidus ULC18]
MGLLGALLVGHEGLIIGLDETLERRWGKRRWGWGRYRDGVQASHKHTVKSSGVRWPWSSRVWGLPFLSLLVPSESTPRGQRVYKSSLDGAL